MKLSLVPPASGLSNALTGAGLAVGAGFIGAKIGGAASTKTNSAAYGAMLGILGTSFGGLVLDASGSRWGRLGRTTALFGVGGLLGLALVSSLQGALGGSSEAPGALPSTTATPGSSGTTSYTLGLNSSGATLNVEVGDTIAVQFPNVTGSGQDWTYASTPTGLTYSGRATSGSPQVTETDTWVAKTPGTYTLTANLGAAATGTAVSSTPAATWTQTIVVSANS